MRNVFFALALVAFAAAPAIASERTDVIASVHQFIDGFNRGDAKTALAACAPQSSIVDEFPPHEWQGSGACARWAHDYDINSQKQSITDGFVTLGQPRHVDITGDRAYVVVPATYTYKQHGKPVTESGSIFTVALRKIAGAWRITGWAWAKN
jgi:hypothetical protein